MVTLIQYEMQLKSFIGEYLDRVIYINETDEDGHSLHNWKNQPFHIIDHGLELHMKRGRQMGLIWGKQFVSYGLDFIEQSLSEHYFPDVTPHEFNLSVAPEWYSLIDKRINHIDVFWHYLISGHSNSPEPGRYYPQTVRIQFEQEQSIYISASKLMPGDKPQPFADEIIVIFQDSIA